MKSLTLMFCLVVGLCGCSVRVAQPLNQPLSANTGATIVKWFQPLVGENRLLYGGRDDSTLLISYREFRTGNGGMFAAPAYTQELRYNLDKSDIITFRDIKIRVSDATNENLSYVILEGPKEMNSDM
ncbi:MAG: hypothetical protein KDD53_04550 [Bdellovibrionales bacterium]|nr:hypothetical protein [Bdellovibrionales bacterium]